MEVLPRVLAQILSQSLIQNPLLLADHTELLLVKLLHVHCVPNHCLGHVAGIIILLPVEKFSHLNTTETPCEETCLFTTLHSHCCNIRTEHIFEMKGTTVSDVGEKCKHAYGTVWGCGIETFHSFMLWDASLLHTWDSVLLPQFSNISLIGRSVCLHKWMLVCNVGFIHAWSTPQIDILSTTWHFSERLRLHSPTLKQQHGLPLVWFKFFHWAGTCCRGWAVGVVLFWRQPRKLIRV